MKLSTSFRLLGFIGALALAAPLSPDQYNILWRFTPIATDTVNALTLRGINANGRHFWIGKGTSTYCPLQGIRCPPGNDTVLDVNSGGASLVSSPQVLMISSLSFITLSSPFAHCFNISSFPHSK